MSEAAAPAAPRPAFAEPLPAKRAPELPDPLPVPGTHDIKKEVSPFDDADWRMRLYTWCGFLLRLLLIAGAVVTAMQYFAAREEKRVEHTLELVTLWEEPQYQEAQRALDARLAPLLAQAAAMVTPDTGPADLQLIYKKIGQAAMTPAGGAMPLGEFKAHLDGIVYFLNRLSFCVEGNICSRAVADAYFRDFAESFWRYFSGYVGSVRKQTSPNYAKPIEDYVNANGAPPAEPPPAGPAAPGDAGPLPKAG